MCYKIKVVCDIMQCLSVYFTGVSEDLVASVFIRLFLDAIENEAVSSTETSVRIY